MAGNDEFAAIQKAKAELDKIRADKDAEGTAFMKARAEADAEWRTKHAPLIETVAETISKKLSSLGMALKPFQNRNPDAHRLSFKVYEGERSLSGIIVFFQNGTNINISKDETVPTPMPGNLAFADLNAEIIEGWLNGFVRAVIEAEKKRLSR